MTDVSALASLARQLRDEAAAADIFGDPPASPHMSLYKALADTIDRAIHAELQAND